MNNNISEIEKRLFDGKTLSEWRKIDEAKRDAVYEEIRAKVGDDITDAIKDFYSLTTPDIIDWLAGLYDPEVGGFYYSESGRDTIGYGPDIESTGQALGILQDLGLFDHVGGDVAKGTPEFMRAQISRFVKSLQHDNGFFYHPQWPKEFVDKYPSRRGRDLSWAVGLVRMGGLEPTYDTPEGAKGDGLLVDGTKVDAQGNGESAALLSEMEAEAKAKEKALKTVPEFLRSEEALRAYLDTLDFKNSSYKCGNELVSQAGQIKHRENQLREEGAEWSAVKIVEDYLNRFQNPETGLWYWKNPGDEGYDLYGAINGMLKTAGVYNGIGIKLPNPLKACKAEISGIYSEEIPITVCFTYNSWLALYFIFKNIRDNAENMDDAEESINSIRKELMVDAINMIKATKKKVMMFRKDNSACSYLVDMSCCTSQWMPVAIPKTNEADVNATVICSCETGAKMLQAFGLPVPPVFGRAEYYRFIELVENHKPIVKTDNPLSEVKNRVWF